MCIRDVSGGIHFRMCKNKGGDKAKETKLNTKHANTQQAVGE